ncbi:retrovirus-related pol polyprotein from transposon tnt 1-94 [Gossypium australe]|uniref:Retrovirus-related pol polyprotein from transposon tnt 1-94 n=1 Tax=Gossypium australe TaxID=47621 RepID=A0A5B6WJK6_9ROSI|nr:retrovirus-related pol polyprotein from transposon tnt 1-94 [Gossypium australe]
MFMFLKIIEPNLTRRQKNMFNFVGYDTCRKGWRFMDTMIKKFVTSTDVVFDEISSWYSGEEISKMNKFPTMLSLNIKKVMDLQPLRRNASRREGGDGVVKRSLREKRQSIHLKDYEVEHHFMFICWSIK